MDSGIYQIRNMINGKRYVGSSVNLRDRKNEHFNDLEKNNHHSVYLQRAFNKYRADSFVFEILEYAPRIKEVLLNLEQHQIDIKSEYNMCKVAGSSYRNPAFLKPVSVFTKNGDRVKSFSCVADAAEHLNCDPSSITGCCQGRKTFTIKGFFTLYGVDVSEQEIQSRLDLIKQSVVNKRKGGNQKRYKVLQYSEQNILIQEFQSLAEARKTIKCRVTHITKAVKDNTLFKGCFWKIKKEDYDK